MPGGPEEMQGMFAKLLEKVNPADLDKLGELVSKQAEMEKRSKLINFKLSILLESVENITWMKDPRILGVPDGKTVCPKCKHEWIG